MPNLPIVGIGASAGGVEALEQFFKSMPADNGMGFVVVTHLPPNRESMLAPILKRARLLLRKYEDKMEQEAAAKRGAGDSAS